MHWVIQIKWMRFNRNGGACKKGIEDKIKNSKKKIHFSYINKNDNI